MANSLTDWIIVRTFTTRAEAEIAQGLLSSEGIESLIQADDLGGMRPELAFVGGFRLLVKEMDQEDAAELLG